MEYFMFTEVKGTLGKVDEKVVAAYTTTDKDLAMYALKYWEVPYADGVNFSPDETPRYQYHLEYETDGGCPVKEIRKEEHYKEGIKYRISRIICHATKESMSKEEERERIGHRIADLRNAKGMPPQGLADIVGMQRNHISRIESGKYSVGFDTLQAIAEALGGTIDIIV